MQPFGPYERKHETKTVAVRSSCSPRFNFFGLFWWFVGSLIGTIAHYTWQARARDLLKKSKLHSACIIMNKCRNAMREAAVSRPAKVQGRPIFIFGANCCGIIDRDHCSLYMAGEGKRSPEEVEITLCLHNNEQMQECDARSSSVTASEGTGPPNIYSRRLDPFYFNVRQAQVPDDLVKWDVRRAQVPDDLVKWEETYKNPLVPDDHNSAQWEINDKYSKETITIQGDRNPKGRTGLTEGRFLPSPGKNIIFHLLITRNSCLPKKNSTAHSQTPVSEYRKVLVFEKNNKKVTPEHCHHWWMSPPGKWSLPVFDYDNVRKPEQINFDSLLAKIFPTLSDAPPAGGSTPPATLAGDASGGGSMAKGDAPVVVCKDFFDKFIKDEEKKKFESWKIFNQWKTAINANVGSGSTYLDDPRNTDYRWVEAAVFHCDVQILDWPQDKDGIKRIPIQYESEDYSFRWIDFDENVISAYDVYSSSRIVIEDHVRRSKKKKETEEKEAGKRNEAGAATNPFTFKFKGKPAVCKFVKIPASGDGQGCVRLFSGPRPDIGWWTKSKKPIATAQNGQNSGGRSANGDSAAAGSGSDTSAMEEWMPNAIISVTGGAQDFKLGKKKEDDTLLIDKIFKNGIVQAAVSMRALIIDGGFSAGVMKQIGRAVMEDGNRVATLGICPWGAISERIQIDQPESKTPCTYEIESGHRNTAFSAALDENHHYFVFVDSQDSGENAWGKEIDMRYKIECALSYTPEGTPDVPHVLVVINGGVNTIGTVHKLSTGSTPTPVEGGKGGSGPKKSVPIVVVEGSGKAADFIACTWRHFHGDSKDTNSNDTGMKDTVECRLCTGTGCVYSSCIMLSQPQSMPGSKCEYLQKRFVDCFGSTKDFEQILPKVVAACKRKEAVTVYDVSDDSDSLSHAILKSVCKGTIQNNGKHYSPDDAMCLLERWNSLDAAKVARTEFLNAHGQEQIPDQLQERLFSSLIHNRVIFVDLLLDFEVRLERKYLNDLYGTISGQGRRMAKIVNEDDDISLERYNQNVRVTDSVRTLEKRTRSLVNIINQNHYYQMQEGGGSAGRQSAVADDNLNFDFRRLILHFMGWGEANILDDNGMAAASPSVLSATTTAAMTPIAGEDLFLWAILTGRSQLAELFWRRCGPELRQHSITRALLACTVLKTIGTKLSPATRKIILGNIENDDTDHSQNNADRFESVACEILDLCYKKSRDKAVSILKMPMFYCSKVILMDKRFRSSFMNALFSPGAMFLNAITLACDAKAHRFASLDAVQACLDEIWTGRIMIFDEDQKLLSREEELGLSDPKGTRFKHRGILSFIPTSWFTAGWKEYKANLDVFLSAFLIVPVLMMKDSSNVESEQRRWSLGDMFTSCGVKIASFYSAPIAKFWIDFASYLTFLVLYTYTGLLMDYEFSWVETVLNFWILALIIGEVFEFFWNGKRYFKANNNIFDAAMLTFYIPSFVMRINECWGMDRTSYNAVGGFPQSNGTLAELQNSTLAVYQRGGEDFLKARSWHGMAGILFWVRLSDFFRVSKTIGPLSQVLLKVSKDALFFLLFLMVFIISFGSAMICAGRPRADPGISFATLVEQAVYLPYIAIFGEHYLNGVTVSWNNNPACDLEQDSSCSSRPKLGIILYALYLFISTVVLLNLLIAMMTKSYDSVLGSSTRAWKFQRMELVLQYSRSSPWPQPIFAVAEIITMGVLRACEWNSWAVRSGSLAKVREDIEKFSVDSEVWVNWEAFYGNDGCMAAMHQEVFHEASPGLTHRGPKDADVPRKAEYMRRCSDLAQRMTAKWVASNLGA